MLNKIKKIVNNDYVFSLIQKMINIITGIVTVSIINRYLGTSLKGEYEYITNIVNILSVILGLGLYASYPFMKRKKMEKQIETYLDVFIFQGIIYIIVAMVVFFITKNKLILLSSALIITQILNTQLQNIGIVEFIRYRQILQIVSYFIDMILTILVYIFLPPNMPILLGILLIKNIIYIVAYLIKCKYRPNPFNIDKKFTYFLIRFGFIAMLTTLLMEFNYRIDVVILKQFVPYSEIGLYSVGSKLAQYIWLIPDAFKEVIFSKTAKKDSIEEVKVVLRINIFITLILIFIIMIFGKIIINILYGAEYLDSYSVTLVMFLGIPSMVLYKIISPLYTANGKQNKCFNILFLSIVANIILNYIYIPNYGKMGAAISSVVSYTICGIVLYIDFIKNYHIKWYECLIINRKDIYKMKTIINNKRRRKPNNDKIN